MFFLGSIATVSTLVIASFADKFSTTIIRVLGFVAALAIGLLTTFDVEDHSNRFLKAWRQLNVACLAYNAEPNRPKAADDLLKAYQQAEDVIGGFSVRNALSSSKPPVDDGTSSPGKK